MAMGVTFAAVPVLAALASMGGLGHPTVFVPRGNRGTVEGPDYGRPLWLPHRLPTCNLDDEPMLLMPTAPASRPLEGSPLGKATKTSSPVRTTTGSPPVMGHGKGRGTKSPLAARTATAAPPVVGQGKGRGTSRASPPPLSKLAPRKGLAPPLPPPPSSPEGITPRAKPGQAEPRPPVADRGVKLPPAPPPQPEEEYPGNVKGPEGDAPDAPTEQADSNTAAPWFGGVVNFALWIWGGRTPTPTGSSGSLRGGRVSPRAPPAEGSPWQWQGPTEGESPEFDDAPGDDEWWENGFFSSRASVTPRPRVVSWSRAQTT